MKKAMLMFSGLLVSTAFVPNLFATCDTTNSTDKTYVAELKSGDTIKYCEKLTEALNEATDGSTVTLKTDVTSTNSEPVKRETTSAETAATFTLDLGEHTITSSTADAALTIADGSAVTIINGTIENTYVNADNATPNYIALFVKKGSAVLNNVTVTSKEFDSDMHPFGAIQVGSVSGTKGLLTVGEGTKITGQIGVTFAGTGSELKVTGGEIEGNSFAVAGNGNPSQCTNTTVTISGGTLTSKETAAIYHPEEGNLTMTGGTLNGLFGIVSRRGTIKVTGGTINATGDATTKATVGDTAIELPVGTAIVVDNKTENYSGDSKVTIGGTAVINSTNTPVYSAKEEPASGEKSTEIIIDGGDFDKDVPDQFLKTGNSQSESGKVGIVHNVKVQENAKNGAVSSVQTAVEGEEVTVNAVPEEGYELSKIVVTDAEGNEVTVTNGKFIMPTSDVTVSATFVAATNPQTGDNIVTYIVMGVVSMVLVGISALYLKKN